ncbi:unnamed protein product [marine sediment metagenome]|uniref:Uncharacterized protein n=1 Tax=marine sediment metagenome TaxID=412755 RepID=X1R2T5_9ZZZZ
MEVKTLQKISGIFGQPVIPLCSLTGTAAAGALLTSPNAQVPVRELCSRDGWSPIFNSALKLWKDTPG